MGDTEIFYARLETWYSSYQGNYIRLSTSGNKIKIDSEYLDLNVNFCRRSTFPSCSGWLVYGRYDWASKLNSII